MNAARVLSRAAVLMLRLQLLDLSFKRFNLRVCRVEFLQSGHLCRLSMVAFAFGLF